MPLFLKENMLTLHCLGEAECAKMGREICCLPHRGELWASVLAAGFAPEQEASASPLTTNPGPL